MRRLKILISAYTCSPVRGSEPGVGWNYVRCIARQHEVWVIVEQEKYQHEIEPYLAAHPELATSMHFYFIRKRRRRLLRRIWPPSYYWYYREWQREAYRLAGRLHQQVSFDLVHQLTMVGFREPGYLWQMNIPFVWGPIGGLGLFPWRFLGSVGLRGGLHYLGRNLYNLAQRRWLRRPRLAAARPDSALIAATTETRADIKHYWGVDSRVMPEVGRLENIPPAAGAQSQTAGRQSGQALEIVWSGTHTPGKALPLLLRAMAGSAWHLHVLGSGRQTTAWQRLATQLGIQEQCRWHGWLDRPAALQRMARSHVCVVTSLADLNSTVVMEALSLGLPLIAPRHCGFVDLISDECGLLVPVVTPRQLVAGIRDALLRMSADENLRQAMSAAARRRADEFSWHDRLPQLERIYAGLVQHGRY